VDNTERDLIQRAGTDPEAFGALYDRHVQEVYRFVCARLHNGAAAEDVTADVFLSALRAMPRYRDQGRPFSCWLLRIATNAVATYYRRQHVTAEVPEGLADGAALIDSIVMRKLEMAGLWRLVGALPPAQRQAMQLRFQQDRSARETARIMGKSEAAVKLLIYRAVGRLRSELGLVPGAVPLPSAPFAT
jgi:RNA polymerase sigma-70 factor (ECF subfamily)